MKEIFRQFRIAQESFVRNLARVCNGAIAKYNKDSRNHTKIKMCRVNVNVWGPKEGKVRVWIQIWLEGGYLTLYPEQIRDIKDPFVNLLGKELFRQAGFDLSCSVTGVHVPSSDD